MPAAPQTVREWLRRVAEERGDASALLGVDQSSLSWSDFAAAVEKAGKTLSAAGAGAGDTVMIALPDGPQALIAILAAASVAAAFPVAEHEQESRYAELAGQVNARVIVCSERLRASLEPVARQRRISLLVVAGGGSAAAPLDLHGATPDAAAPSSERRAPSLDDPAVLIATSGATAAPKIVSSSQASLFASIAHCAEWLSLTLADRSLCVMPFAHLHSIVRSTLPGLLAGGSVVCTPGLDRGRVLDWIDATRPTYITAAPSVYRILTQRMAETGWRPEQSSLRLLVTGSDSIDAATVAEIARTFGRPLLQFYGLSEVAPLIAVTPRDVPPPAGAVGKINPAWSVACLDEAGKPVPAGRDGEIAVRGGTINPVIGGSGGTSQRFTDDGYFRTGDLGRVDQDGWLFVAGRADDRIHSGGRKIDPQAVEALLLKHPAVDRVVVFGVPDPVLGHRVAAAVVLHPSAQVAEAELQALVGDGAQSYMVPERIVFVGELPTNSAGKVTRSSLAELLGLADAPRPVAAAPPAGDAIEERLARIFADRLSLAEVDRTRSFAELGGDSFNAIELLFEIEDLFGARIPPAIFTRHASVVALAALIRASHDRPASRMLPLRQEGRFPPLFVAYNVEGNVGYSEAIRGATGPDQPLYACSTLTSRNEAANPERIEEQAAPLVGAMRSLQPHGPYHLIGYSYGSHLALEIAQQLFDQGEVVAFLGVIDDSADLDRRHFGIEGQAPATKTTETCNQWALRRYVPKPYPGKITLFRASDPVDVYQSDPHAGWGDIALGGVEMHDIHGNHETIVTQAGFGWGALLEICLAKSRRASVVAASATGEMAKTVRRARALAANKSHRHTVDARIAAKAGDRDAEIREYRKALQVQPDQPLWVKRNLAEALIESGKTAAGWALLEEALAADPWPLWHIVNLARMKRSLNRTAEVRALYELGRGLAADDPDVLGHWAHLCVIAGELDEAEKAIRRAIVLEQRKPFAEIFLSDLHGYLSDLLTSRGRREEAIAAARESARLDPASTVKARRLAQLVSGIVQPAPAFATSPPATRAMALR